MRDDFAPPNLGHVPKEYEQRYFETVLRSLEQFQTRLMSLGPIRVSSVTTDNVNDTSKGVLWLDGAGTPEGVVVAPVGSFYSRTDGGAGTTFYVKESGTGNTGWVGK